MVVAVEIAKTMEVSVNNEEAFLYPGAEAAENAPNCPY